MHKIILPFEHFNTLLYLATNCVHTKHTVAEVISAIEGAKKSIEHIEDDKSDDATED